MVNYGKLKQSLKQRVLTNPKESRKRKKNNEQTRQIKKQQDGGLKSNQIISYIKCVWSKHPN